MSNPGMRLTADGLNVLAKGLTGQEIHFTKGALGDGDFDYNSESVVTMTALKSWKMDMPIVGKELHGDGCAIIKTRLCNANLTQGFAAKEIGIYAIDQDTGAEILYAYRNCGDEYSFIPGNSGPVQINVTKAYMIEIRDAENVTFNIDWSFAYVSELAFLELKERFIPIFSNFLTPSEREIAKILSKKLPFTEEKSSENGVPTGDEIIAILNSNYTHTEIARNDYLAEVISADDIKDILENKY